VQEWQENKVFRLQKALYSLKQVLQCRGGLLLSSVMEIASQLLTKGLGSQYVIVNLTICVCDNNLCICVSVCILCTF
jgi:hypothetical protein